MNIQVYAIQWPSSIESDNIRCCMFTGSRRRGSFWTPRIVMTSQLMQINRSPKELDKGKWNYDSNLPIGHILEARHKPMASVLTLYCIAISYHLSSLPDSHAETSQKKVDVLRKIGLPSRVVNKVLALEWIGPISQKVPHYDSQDMVNNSHRNKP